MLKLKTFLKNKPPLIFPNFHHFSKIPNNPETTDLQSKKFRLIPLLPKRVQVYLRLGRYDRPMPILFLYLPCAWGLTLGAPVLNSAYLFYLGYFGVLSVSARAAGCIINDIWDKELDKKVERTSNRPLAQGEVTVNQALALFFAHVSFCVSGLFILPPQCVLTTAAIIPFTLVYPFMKRITYFPQLVLGLCFNSGLIVCYPTLCHTLIIGDIGFLYLAGIMWTLIYDTIYAHMDKEDDLNTGIMSTALLFQEKTKVILTLFTLALGVFVFLNFKGDLTALSKILLSVGIVTQLALLYHVNLKDRLSCLKVFKNNTLMGFILLAICISEKLAK